MNPSGPRCRFLFPALVILLLWGASEATLHSAESPSVPRPFGQARGLRVHDPSTIVRSQDEWWLFTTGIGVSSLRSKDLIEWKPGPAVFTKPPEWTRQVVPEHRGYFWAPDVIRVQGRYFLYYSVSSWGKNNSAIALASNATLDPADPAFRWKDEGIVIRSQPSDVFNAIDPCVMLDADGRLWMAFGSFWSGIKLVELDPATGRRLMPESPLVSLAHHEAIEAPFLHRHSGQYFLFVNWGLCCRGTNSTYEIRVGRSLSVTGPYLDQNGVDLLQGGGSLLLGTRGSEVGPGHAGIVEAGNEKWLSFHYYDGAHGGRATLGLRKLSWSTNGWPVVGESREIKLAIQTGAF
ncbi:MAG: arabinan endo-1,5-alpha-L-arabinosidase [Verrucomicrobia bacterium]|nr:arabinan endo-1,5-alpha-L-arabinosidase [Verrucomicrobiota bacterium]